MTQHTFTALFETYGSASAAVTRLQGIGLSEGQISLVSNDAVHRTATDPYSGTTTGASLGTLIGGGAGLLAGLGILAIPGLGPVVAAGWLASTLVGAGVGASAGGMVGALTEAGISSEDAEAFAEGLQRGGTLVTVRAGGAQAGQIAEILERDGTAEHAGPASGWREMAWSGAAGAGQNMVGTANPGAQTYAASLLDPDQPPARVDGRTA